MSSGRLLGLTIEPIAHSPGYGSSSSWSHIAVRSNVSLSIAAAESFSFRPLKDGRFLMTHRYLPRCSIIIESLAIRNKSGLIAPRLATDAAVSIPKTASYENNIIEPCMEAKPTQDLVNHFSSRPARSVAASANASQNPMKINGSGGSGASIQCVAR